jgi:hypothetical protein
VVVSAVGGVVIDVIFVVVLGGDIGMAWRARCEWPLDC